MDSDTLLKLRTAAKGRTWLLACPCGSVTVKWINETELRCFGCEMITTKGAAALVITCEGKWDGKGGVHPWTK